MFKPVAQVPRYRLVAQQIADRILEGALKAGQKMPAERVLVESLGVSRATIREALIALEITGYVENRFGAGVQVAARPPRDNQLLELAGPGPFELLEARIMIEGEVAALAAENIGPEEIARLKMLIDAMQNESGSAFWGENADEEFHLTIARATGNLALVNAVAEFWRQRLQMPMWVKIHSRVNVDAMKPQLIQEHVEIVAALELGNGPKAREAMRRHIALFGAQILDGWQALAPEDRQEVSPPPERLRRRVETEIGEWDFPS
ncbi:MULTISPECIES: FadR/GntR family transcriptional regulator [Falsihalocynthiibacter]|uniref:FadR/GntR family transcriptional regulator n=1 Tax=Falsihalocynthiibacter TaxID=2854182 RepID=UPI003001BF04